MTFSYGEKCFHFLFRPVRIIFHSFVSPEVFEVCDFTVFFRLPYRTLIPLFDQDTNALFLAGKGDNNVRFFECTNKDPFLIEGMNLI